MIGFISPHKQLISKISWGIFFCFGIFRLSANAEVQLEYSRMTLGGADHQSQRLSVQDSITFNVGQAIGSSKRYSVGTPHLFGNNGIVTAIDSNGITIEWDADETGNVMYFHIFCDPPGHPVGYAEGNVNSFTDNRDLEVGMSYTYWIVAENAEGHSWSYLDENLVVIYEPDDTTPTATATATATGTPTPTLTPTETPAAGSSPTPSPTNTNLPTATYSPTLTMTPTLTPTATREIKPPQANIGVQSDTEGPPPLLVLLQGGGSSESPIIQTGWAFHEADVLEITHVVEPTSSLIESVSFEYSSAGNYTAAFRVWNEAGLSQAATQEIIVWTLTPTPPVTETPSPTLTATASGTPTVTLSPTLSATVTPTATVAMVTLEEMDLDGDDVIGAGDLLMLMPAVQQSQDQTGQHHEKDFNRDGRIDCKDLWLLGNHWGKEIVEEN